MIKRLLQVGLILACFASMPSWAITIDDPTAGSLVDGIDVGVVDTFVAATGILGSPTNEVTWINSVLSSDLEYAVKTEEVVYYNTSVVDTFAF